MEHPDPLKGFRYADNQPEAQPEPTAPFAEDDLGAYEPTDRRPERIALFTDGDLDVEIELGFVLGRAEPVGVTVRSRSVEGAVHTSALSTRRFRSIPFGALADEARRIRKRELQDVASKEVIFVDADGRTRASFSVAAAKLEMAELEAPLVGRPRLPLEDIEAAAEIYRKAQQAGSRHPTMDVATKMHLERSTAAKWVQRARKLGLIATYVRPKKVAGKAAGPGRST
jgi:hypothetical protein